MLGYSIKPSSNLDSPQNVLALDAVIVLVAIVNSWF